MISSGLISASVASLSLYARASAVTSLTNFLRVSPESSSAKPSLRAWNGCSPAQRVEVLLEDGFGVLGRDLLDLHPAELRGHQHRQLGGTVEDDAEVELAGDPERLLDEHLVDDPSLGTGLLGDQLHAEDLAGDR